MLDNIKAEKIYMTCIKNNISSGSKVFYIYLLHCIDSNDLFVLDDKYICELFKCSLKTLYNWINELMIFRMIKYKKKLIYVY